MENIRQICNADESLRGTKFSALQRTFRYMSDTQSLASMIAKPRAQQRDLDLVKTPLPLACLLRRIAI